MNVCAVLFFMAVPKHISVPMMKIPHGLSYVVFLTSYNSLFLAIADLIISQRDI